MKWPLCTKFVPQTFRKTMCVECSHTAAEHGGGGAHHTNPSLPNVRVSPHDSLQVAVRPQKQRRSRNAGRRRRSPSRCALSLSHTLSRCPSTYAQEPKAPTLRSVKKEEPREEPRAAAKTRDEPRHRDPEPSSRTSTAATSSSSSSGSSGADADVKDTMRCVVVKDGKPVVESRATPKVSRDEV